MNKLMTGIVAVIVIAAGIYVGSWANEKWPRKVVA